MAIFRSIHQINGFIAADGAHVQEIAGLSNGLTSHSLALITHPSGTGSRPHRHTRADEIYLVWQGQGRVRVNEEERVVNTGDTVIIRPGDHHEVWNDGPADLVLLVTCAPAYDATEVVWDE